MNDLSMHPFPERQRLFQINRDGPATVRRHTSHSPAASVLPKLSLLSLWHLGSVTKAAANSCGRNETVPIRLMCKWRGTNGRTCNSSHCRPECGWPLLSISRASRCEHDLTKRPLTVRRPPDIGFFREAVLYRFECRPPPFQGKIPRASKGRSKYPPYLRRQNCK
jgi:hypothetical protein